MKSNRIASIIIESNRELGESFQAYPQYVNLKSDVPQGGVLSPILFNQLYTSDIPQALVQVTSYSKMTTKPYMINSLEKINTTMKFITIVVDNWKFYTFTK